jgi:hypothetical protein
MAWHGMAWLLILSKTKQKQIKKPFMLQVQVLVKEMRLILSPVLLMKEVYQVIRSPCVIMKMVESYSSVPESIPTIYNVVP